jgi:hypothetical protein
MPRAGSRRGTRAAAALLAAVVLLGGCATVDPFAHSPMREHLARADGVGDCARLLQELDRQVRAAGARDAQQTVVPGFPYLRADRLDAALAAAADDEARWRLWRARLAANDRNARLHEFRNATVAGGPVHAPLGIDACRRVLLDADDTAAARAALRAAAVVPDDYSSALRALGLYPLTRLAFVAGIRAWHARTRDVFAVPLEALPVEGVLRRYAPTPDAARGLAAAPDRWRAAGAPVAPITRDALGVPRVESLAVLLQRHAPVIEVDETGAHDRIGPLAYDATGQVTVDLAEPPVAYARLAFGALGGVLRPQLVYTVWFPARPQAHALDPLAGTLDALVWRVTLDDGGRALVYDSIHACGCYHQFFATDAVRPKAAPPADQGRFDEGLFMPQPPLPAAVAGQRIALRVAARTHYLQRVRLTNDEPAGVNAVPPPLVYRLQDEDTLRSLPASAQDGSRLWRSAYDEQGMIAGTERLERFFFWPMGIASAGQMRQWGRHATAFVGRRHFDDPALLDRYFELPPPDAAPPVAAVVPALNPESRTPNPELQ